MSINIERIRTISEFHHSRHLPGPEHPLISVIDYAEVKLPEGYQDKNWVFDFYFISLKKNIGGMIRYGQQLYDFNDGIMFFIGPGQVFSIDRSPQENGKRSGWMLLIHPDFLWKTPLTTKIKRYDYFDYAINEALFVSIREEHMLETILDQIRNEYHNNLDNFSQGIIISQLEMLLNYTERFYNRQFLTRKKASSQLLDLFENELDRYFSSADSLSRGLPAVQYFADRLNISAKYLSRLLRILTGQSAQQHIHNKLIAEAKERLSTTELSVAEIAYALGFEHSQSFSKLFKIKTRLSPLQFRRSFDVN